MRILNLTLPTPEENLACDEALLDAAEEDGSGEVLRFWEPAQRFVVVGYANRVATEVNVEFCERHQVPILRRCSGGGTVLQGPGCLNYCLILRVGEAGPLRGISSTNEFILKRHQAALAALLGVSVEIRGHTDLAIEGVKFSGNAQRRKRGFLLFHGSFLLDMDIDFIQDALPMPSKAPQYRVDRPHVQFLMNLKVPPAIVRTTLANAWSVTEPIEEVPYSRIETLTVGKYQNRGWNCRF